MHSPKEFAAFLLLGVLTGCAERSEVADPVMPADRENPIFRTLDGKRFATEAARTEYLQNTEEARRERELIALERTRQERIATDLGALQRQRARQRANAALAEAEAAEREADQLRRIAGLGDQDDAAIRDAEKREAQARRTEKRARRQSESQPFQNGRAPWQRLIRYRRAEESLSAFRRRVVAAIGRAQASGGRVEDYL